MVRVCMHVRCNNAITSVIICLVLTWLVMMDASMQDWGVPARSKG